MSNRRPPDPKRLRQVPPQFSWIDHRLVRDDYFQHGSCEAMALYLFLLTVADPRGLSYYSQPSLMKQLKLGLIQFAQARQELIALELIAFEHPLYQVLALTPGSTASELSSSARQTGKTRHADQPVAIKQLLSQLTTGNSND